MRTVIPLIGALVALSACAKNPGQPDDIVDELPAWMTHGEEVRLQVAKKLLETGNAVGTLDVVRQMRSEGYDSGELDLLQGEALQKTGLPSEAEDLLLQAAAKLPKDARPHERLCVLFADDKRLDQAIVACERAVELDDKRAHAWNNLGFLLLSADRPAEALVATKKAVALDSTQVLYRNNLAWAMIGTGEIDRAFKTLQSTLRRADAAYMVGLAVERFQGEENARVWYERTLEFDATHAEAKLRLAEEPQAPGGPGAQPEEL